MESSGPKMSSIVWSKICRTQRLLEYSWASPTKLSTKISTYDKCLPLDESDGSQAFSVLTVDGVQASKKYMKLKEYSRLVAIEGKEISLVPTKGQAVKRQAPPCYKEV